MLLAIFLLVTGAATSKAATRTVAPDVYGHLGYGYDIMSGNPDPRSWSLLSATTDPGYKLYTIFTPLSEKNVRKFTLNQEFSGFSSRYVASAEEYADYLMLTVNAELHYKEISFAANVQYSNVHKQSLTKTSLSMEIYSIVEVDEYELDMEEKPPMSAYFLKSANELPLTWNDSATNHQMYRHFVDDFGTHVVTRLITGAKCIMDATFTTANFACMSDESGSGSIAAAGQAYAALKGNISSMTEAEKKLARSFEERTSAVREQKIGLVNLADTESCASAIRKKEKIRPDDIRVELRSLDKFLSPRYFDSVPAEQLLQKRQALYEFIRSEYCNYLMEQGGIAGESCNARPTKPFDPLKEKCSSNRDVASWLTIYACFLALMMRA